MRAPRVVAVTKIRIHTVRGNPGKSHYFHRWYVTFDFGGFTKKLAISEKAARWMQSLPERCDKCKRPTPKS